jgi:hypothetical protein
VAGKYPKEPKTVGLEWSVRIDKRSIKTDTSRARGKAVENTWGLYFARHIRRTKHRRGNAIPSTQVSRYQAQYVQANRELNCTCQLNPVVGFSSPGFRFWILFRACPVRVVLNPECT